MNTVRIPLLEVDRLLFGYHHPLASPLSASLYAGQLVAVLGLNGTGKSTLLSVLSGELAPLAGSILAQGRSVPTLSPRQRANTVAFLPATLPAIPGLSVEEFVQFGLFPKSGWLARYTPQQRRSVVSAIRVVGLQELAFRQIVSLSDGERQRASIALALAQGAPITLLDEPTAHLDIASKAEIMALLRRVAHARHNLVILATHDLGIAMEYADLLWVFTGEGVELHAPEDAALTGVLSRVFDTRTTRFDPLRLSFTLPVDPGGNPKRAFQLYSPGLTLAEACTRHALLRYGWREVNNDCLPALRVEIVLTQGIYRWNVNGKPCRTIAQLLQLAEGVGNTVAQPPQ